MVITVASGKGGTGKTTVATSLAVANAECSPLLLDCDVEAPNAHIFLKPRWNQRQIVTLPIPLIDESRCTGCGRCAEVCPYHAILTLGVKVLVFPELCHGCGSCTLQCPEEAIAEVPHPLGLLESGPAKFDIDFARGVLNIGEPMAVPVIRQLKQWRLHSERQLVIRDAPPGNSCPLVETIRGADFVLLVTEPTPFGLHDMRLAIQLTRELCIPTGVLINRDGVGDDGVETYCRDGGIPILMRIPLDPRIGGAVARGETLVEAFPEYLPQFRALCVHIQRLIERRRDEAALEASMTHHSIGARAASS